MDDKGNEVVKPITHICVFTITAIDLSMSKLIIFVQTHFNGHARPDTLIIIQYLIADLETHHILVQFISSDGDVFFNLEKFDSFQKVFDEVI